MCAKKDRKTNRLAPHNFLTDFIVLEDLQGKQAVFKCHGKDPEAVAAIVSMKQGMPMRVVKENDK